MAMSDADKRCAIVIYHIGLHVRNDSIAVSITRAAPPVRSRATHIIANSAPGIERSRRSTFTPGCQ